MRVLGMCLAALIALSAYGIAAEERPKMTDKEVVAAVSAVPTGTAAEALVAGLRKAFGDAALCKGIVRQDGLTLAWVRESAAGAPIIVEVGNWTGKRHGNGEPLVEPARRERHPLSRLGNSDLYVAAVTFPNHLTIKYDYEIDGQCAEGGWLRTDEYPVHPDSQPKPEMPKGTVTKHHWKSTIFAGTERDYWIYVPAQYRPGGTPASVMVFQDGGMYVDAGVPVVFDNLIAKGEMPVTVGVFVSAGSMPGDAGKDRNIRIEEYHDLTDRYARFLCDELLPEVEKTVKLRHDPDSRAICGISSGAVCAFTAAWQRPDVFSKVVCHVGSFVNIRGTYTYPFLIRDTERKPLRIWLEDGAQDIDDDCGSWVLANQQMAAALKFRGYDYHFDFGPGFHGLEHGAATLPDTLRWLWRDHRSEK
jgi:enterochelin esterase family protein